MFRKRGFAAVIAALLITVFTVVGCGGQKKQRVSIATGGSGGVFFVLGAGIADLITKNSPKMQATSETTAATGENLRLVNTGEAQFAFTVFDATSDAYNGVTPYKKHDNIRLILRGHAGFLHAYVQENSEITRSQGDSTIDKRFEYSTARWYGGCGISTSRTAWIINDGYFQPNPSKIYQL